MKHTFLGLVLLTLIAVLTARLAAWLGQPWRIEVERYR